MSFADLLQIFADGLGGARSAVIGKMTGMDELILFAASEERSLNSGHSASVFTNLQKPEMDRWAGVIRFIELFRV